MPGKKKATGLSKRQSFLDRNVIAENKAILRFNEAMVDEARGVQRSRGSAEDGDRDRARARPARPARTPRPTLPPEQETALRAAVAGASDVTSVEAAGARLVDALARGDRFERASEAGWRVLTDDPAAAGRSTEEWDGLRSAWTAVRRVALAEWVSNHPEAAELQEKEAKAAARAERAATRRPAVGRTGPRRPRSRPTVKVDAESAVDGEAEATEAHAEPAGATEGSGPPEDKRRRPRRRRPRRGGDRPLELEGAAPEPPAAPAAPAGPWPEPVAEAPAAPAEPSAEPVAEAPAAPAEPRDGDPGSEQPAGAGPPLPGSATPAEDDSALSQPMDTRVLDADRYESAAGAAGQLAQSPEPQPAASDRESALPREDGEAAPDGGE